MRRPFATACVHLQGRVPAFLRGRSMVILQQAAQTLTASDAVIASRANADEENQHVAQALMIALMVIMRDELADRSS
jgi:hypothetical protein